MDMTSKLFKHKKTIKEARAQTSKSIQEQNSTVASLSPHRKAKFNGNTQEQNSSLAFVGPIRTAKLNVNLRIFACLCVVGLSAEAWSLRFLYLNYVEYKSRMQEYNAQHSHPTPLPVRCQYDKADEALFESIYNGQQTPSKIKR